MKNRREKNVVPKRVQGGTRFILVSTGAPILRTAPGKGDRASKFVQLENKLFAREGIGVGLDMRIARRDYFVNGEYRVVVNWRHVCDGYVPIAEVADILGEQEPQDPITRIDGGKERELMQRIAA